LQGIDLLFLSGYSNDAKEGVDTNVLDKMQQLRKVRPIYMKLDKVKAFKVQPFGAWCLVSWDDTNGLHTWRLSPSCSTRRQVHRCRPGASGIPSW
jgi:hypothetical protein